MQLSVQCTCKCVDSRDVACKPLHLYVQLLQAAMDSAQTVSRKSTAYSSTTGQRPLVKVKRCHLPHLIFFFFSKQQYSFAEGYLREMLQARIELSWHEIKKQQLQTPRNRLPRCYCITYVTCRTSETSDHRYLALSCDGYGLVGYSNAFTNILVKSPRFITPQDENVVPVLLQLSLHRQILQGTLTQSATGKHLTLTSWNFEL